MNRTNVISSPLLYNILVESEYVHEPQYLVTVENPHIYSGEFSVS